MKINDRQNWYLVTLLSAIALATTSLASTAVAAPSTGAPALISNGGTLHSFADAVNLPLRTDAEFGRFVDPQVTGSDRALSIFLLKLLPPRMRGDFVYVNAAGRVLSNRLAVGAAVRFKPRRVAAEHLSPPFDPLATFRSSGVPESRQPIPDSYPPTGGTGGAYIRNYSSQGVNALYGYATPPCDVNLPSGDSGNMYFNAYDQNGSDVVDAGIGANNTSRALPGLTPQQTLSPFITPYQGNGWTNFAQLWPCGSPLGMMYGTLPPPNQGLSMLGVGVPSYDPTQMQLPPTTTTWTSAAWNFFPTSSVLTQGGGIWNAIPSNCMLCSVARMLSIGQTSPGNDGSCFGGCGSSADARWDETVGGELVPDCSQVPQQSFTCTIEYLTSGSWQGNENDSNYGIIFDDVNNQQGLEGINLRVNSPSSRSRLPNAKFRPLPLPVAPAQSCTVDSQGYCSSLASRAVIGRCDTGQTGAHGQPIYVTLSRYSYYIFQKQRMLELMETATETTVAGPNNCYPVSNSWSPNNPATTYNDTNLP